MLCSDHSRLLMILLGHAMCIYVTLLWIAVRWLLLLLYLAHLVICFHDFFQLLQSRLAFHMRQQHTDWHVPLLIHAARRWGMPEDVGKLLADACAAAQGLWLPDFARYTGRHWCAALLSCVKGRNVQRHVITATCFATLEIRVPTLAHQAGLPNFGTYVSVDMVPYRSS
eukprot:GHRQ01033532.1.p1 GENE.GHRQ01033532.1~~GHRQ01033532.1.p1  ORF type:complete len:169 (-),score=6.40 GHRQ01033532.1:146-652(-)